MERPLVARRTGVSAAASDRPIPRATYRLQLHQGFGFRAAAALVPYLARLGVSHLYLSPYLRARPGSSHGYDIVDHGQLNPELGSEGDYRRLVAALRQNGLRQIVDFVPNHMGVGGADNPLWLDILEWGAESEYAGWFDIDWAADGRRDPGKLLVPLLGDQYGAVLASGDLRLRFDPVAGSFAVWAYETHKLPLSPLHYDRILGRSHPELERLGDSFSHLAQSRSRAANESRELKAELAALVAREPRLEKALGREVDRFEGRPGDLASWQRLQTLIADQHWRVAHFRVAADDINYRRFFNVNELAGLRMELPEVFEHAHALLFQLIAEGGIDGVRVDHIDGLLDPKRYCHALREHAPQPIYLIVEKILAPHERLREDWGVEGTTGYEFANLASGLLLDPAGEQALDEFYASFTGSRSAFPDIVRAAKIQIMENEMAGELRVLARQASAVARFTPLTADFTENLIERALRQVIAAFPVYRTYVDGAGSPTPEDRRDIDWAFALARRHDPSLDPSVFDFLQGLLTCDLVARPKSGFSRVEVIRVAMRAQQYSGPVMAKGLEDTSFYRFNRMLALNEVGGQPGTFGVSIAAFHHANRQRAEHAPHSMLATATHDTKRGEDARARLAVLSEMPEDWIRHVTIWSRMLRGPEGSDTPPLPSLNDEYAFYQTLLGAWPSELAEPDVERTGALRERIGAAMLKFVREAKVHTTWARPNAAYEDAMRRFVNHALDSSRANAFLESFGGFARRVAEFGFQNSLVQTVLKFTVPGVPDIYQGAELWDFNLVDPDNRRPVDFTVRETLLSSVVERDPSDLVHGWEEGGIKLRIIADLLRYRRLHRALFDEGSYRPLRANGPAADRICAFERALGEETLFVAVALHPTRGKRGFESTTLPIRPPAHGGWMDLFTARHVQRRGRGISANALFAELPVAVLIDAV